MALLLATGCSPSKSAPTPARQQATSPTPAHPAGEIQATPRIREELPIRLGGVYTLGLGEGSKDFEDSAGLGVKLSADNQQWIAYNCDVIALSATTITPETFPALYKTQRLITPLLYVYASSLYEQPDHKGNVGGWKPEMAAWTLRDSKGIEVPNSDRG